MNNGGCEERVVVVRPRYKLCPACGNFSAITEKLIFCMVCGEKLIDECGQCKEPIIYPTARFCPACGASLVVTTRTVVLGANEHSKKS